jgi:hypothetical protein
MLPTESIDIQIETSINNGKNKKSPNRENTISKKRIKMSKV